MINVHNVVFDPNRFIYAEEITGGIRIFLEGLPAERNYIFLSISKADTRKIVFQYICNCMNQHQAEK